MEGRGVSPCAFLVSLGRPHKSGDCESDRRSYGGDPETSKEFAEVIGRQEVQEMMVGFNRSFLKSSSVSHNLQIKEQYTVEPTELQHLPALNGVLSVEGQNPALVAL